jgi:hypothetical protein
MKIKIVWKGCKELLLEGPESAEMVLSRTTNVKELQDFISNKWSKLFAVSNRQSISINGRAIHTFNPSSILSRDFNVKDGDTVDLVYNPETFENLLERSKLFTTGI